MYSCRLVLTLLCVLPVWPVGVQASEPGNRAQFDPALAETLGADQYGMRPYVMAFLEAGPDQSHDAEQAQALQAGHMAHIRELAEAGKLVVAGPFLDRGELRGIFILAVATVEEAEALVAADPAVAAGRLNMRLRPWYGSAALMQMGELHERIAREDP